VYVVPVESINSDTRTKTVNFSNNVCSMEVIKDYEHLTALGHEWNGNLERSNEESVLEPPGFERIAKVNKGHANDNELLPSKEGQQGELSLESPGVNQSGPSQQGKELRAIPNRKPKKTTNQGAEGNSQGSKGNSEDSLEQLAIEALEIGNLLGVTVIQHKRPAKEKANKSSRKPKAPVARKGEARSRGQQDPQNC